MKKFLLFNSLQWQAADAIWIVVQLSTIGQKLRNGFCFWLLVGLLLLNAERVQAQIYSGSIRLESQADVNAFNYTEVTGNLTVQGSYITDLRPIAKLTKVGGVFHIANNSNLTNLVGLENLTSVGGDLYIRNNRNLNSLAGLQNLTSVGKDLWISISSLSSLRGLENLTSVGRSLSIGDNPSLSSLTALEKLISLEGDLFIVSNNSLNSLAGLQNLASVENDILILANKNLNSLVGLQNLASVGRELHISLNSSLNSLAGLEKLASVGGDLYIKGNSQLSQCCQLLPIIKATKGTVNIEGNATNCESQSAIEAACTPVITAQPQAAMVCAGEKATFRVEATGTGLSFQWQQNGQDISGTTASTYTLAAVAAQDADSYTVIVSNAYTSVKSQAATLTVNSLPKPTITPIPTSNVYTGGNPNIIYLGYGAQSVKLQASGGVSYTWNQATGLNKTNIADPVFTPTQAGTYTFTVTATSSSGCQATRSVTIMVIDARSDSKKNQVLVCHNSKKLSIDPISVPDHLAHCDKLGTCAGTLPASRSSKGYSMETEVAALPSLQGYPNPFSGQTTIAFSFTHKEEYTLAIYDLNGTLVKQLPGGKVKANEQKQVTWQVGKAAAGLYIARLTTATAVHQLKLIVK